MLANLPNAMEMFLENIGVWPNHFEHYLVSLSTQLFYNLKHTNHPKREFIAK